MSLRLASSAKGTRCETIRSLEQYSKSSSTSLFHASAVPSARPQGSAAKGPSKNNFRQPQRFRLAKLEKSSSFTPRKSSRQPLGLPGSRPSGYAPPKMKAFPEKTPGSSAEHGLDKRSQKLAQFSGSKADHGSAQKGHHLAQLKGKMAGELTTVEHHGQAALDEARPPSTGNFTSPPLLPGLVDSLQKELGANAKPSAIQALAISHLLRPGDGEQDHLQPFSSTQTLLASETGSGKSIAYLLPLLQSLKTSELHPPREPSPTGVEEALPEESELSEAPKPPPISPGPRAIVLAPTHELCRQLSSYAKSLCHGIKLRVQCLSNPNRTRARTNIWNETGKSASPAPSESTGRRVDVMVGTPSRVLTLTGGVELSDHRVISASERTWTEEEGGEYVGVPDNRMDLKDVEWVIIDEADVLFGRDFLQSTQAILREIKLAREAHLQQASQTPLVDATDQPLPFNLILSSATIPVSLSNYLDAHHPNITRLASPRLHRLPKNLRTEYAQWTGGNRMSDIVKKIEEVWASEATTQKRLDAFTESTTQGQLETTTSTNTPMEKSKILIFYNEKDKVKKLAEYLEKEKGINCLTMVGDADGRRKGSNKHLAEFLNPSTLKLPPPSGTTSGPSTPSPSILITTSLLSRGLDFSPSIKHVFVVDEPRSAVDFLHRAGRTGRAGRFGTVVVFEKGSRGSRRSAKKASKGSRERISAVL